MAWTILRSAADYFVTIADAGAEQGVAAYGREQPAGRVDDAERRRGLERTDRSCADPAARELVGIDGRSVILTVCSESRPDMQAMRALLASMRQAVPA